LTARHILQNLAYFLFLQYNTHIIPKTLWPTNKSQTGNIMPSPKNQSQLKNLSDKLKKATSVIITDHTNLSVANKNQLSQSLNPVNAEYSVTKNTLLKIALKPYLSNPPESVQTALTGPTAALITYDDQASAIKTLVNFIKNYQLPSIKLGLDLTQTSDSPKIILNPDIINNIAKLPNLNQLLGNLLKQLQAPAQNLMAQLQAPTQNLLYALLAIKNKKGGDA